ncbi:MAG: guanylate kinase [Gammaproteobacteria bacterium]|jgi:guanylate kinase|nr:guanylate kinase [Gammaproteobacteria bacterium]
MDRDIGNLIVISAPSGAGKTSLVRAMVASTDAVSTSTSYTTRSRRAGETEGEDYFFVDKEAFRQMISNGDFLEHAEVFGNLYGTSRAQVQRSLDNGIDLMLEIDWQGARNVRRVFPEAVSIFILPPSKEVLRERLIGRGGDNLQVIEQRMEAAMSEMSHFGEYEFLVINDDFDQALEEVCAIVTACRLKTAVQRRRLRPNLAGLMASADAL